MTVGRRIRVTGEIGPLVRRPTDQGASVRSSARRRVSAPAARSPRRARRGRRMPVRPGQRHRRRGQAARQSWRAEIQVGGERVAVTGSARRRDPPDRARWRARAPASAESSARPYPTATDRRYAIVPRGPADIAVGPACGRRRPVATGTDGRQAGGRAPIRVPRRWPGRRRPHGPRPPRRREVRAGGLVIELTPTGSTLDDGTAVGRVRLLDAAAEYLGARRAGRRGERRSAVRSERRATRGARGADPAGLIRAGDLADPPSPTAGAHRRAAADPWRPDRRLDEPVRIWRSGGRRGRHRSWR